MKSKLITAALSAVMLLSAANAQSGILFSEDFANNSAGWTLGPEWQIGSATASTGGNGGTGPDPAFDHTATADNGVAGVVIGGNAGTSLHGHYYLTSPTINAGSTVGPVKFDFWRWLNSDYPPFMSNIIEVFDGTAWQTLWSGPGSSPIIKDTAWNLHQFDITAYANSALQLRWGFNITSGGVYTVSSWNVDDVVVYDASVAPPPAVPEPGTLALFGLGLAGLGVARRKRMI